METYIVRCVDKETERKYYYKIQVQRYNKNNIIIEAFLNLCMYVDDEIEKWDFVYDIKEYNPDKHDKLIK